MMMRPDIRPPMMGGGEPEGRANPVAANRPMEIGVQSGFTPELNRPTIPMGFTPSMPVNPNYNQ